MVRSAIIYFKYYKFPEGVIAMKLGGVKSTNKKMHSIADAFGNLLVDGFHFVALFAILLTIIISAALTLTEMVAKRSIFLEPLNQDAFIYLALVLKDKGMFDEAENFNQPIGDWDVSNVTDMIGMFI